MKCFPFSRRANRGASSRPGFPHRGFSLVEIMVALVIGMIGVLVIMQVARTGEAQKRATTGSGDAQSNGALALHALQWDIKQAGYGFSSINLLGCQLKISTTTNITVAPVKINALGVVPPGDANTDTLLILYGNGAGSPEGDHITGGGHGSAPEVSPAAYYKKNDWVVGALFDPIANCNLVLSRVEEEPLKPRPINPSDPESEKVTTGKQVKLEQSISPDGVERNVLYNLGSEPKAVGYAIRGGNLTTCDFRKVDCANSEADQLRANWQIVANDIVSLKAQYGHDGIDKWNRTAPELPENADNNAAKNHACEWSRITSLRLALVARNSEWNRVTVTGADANADGVDDDGGNLPTIPPWAGSKENPLDSGSEVNPIDLSGITNWKHYRYQVYESIMPIRNLLGIDSKSCKS
jgi:type IV pilus assembly protein PilW